jgi:predicted Rossmann fold flavoprotein
VILSTGGVSYPVTGSTGDGYRLAESVGHTVKPPVPSLVGLTSDDEICAASMGLALKNVAVTVTDTAKKKIVYKDFGEMLFCHFGISGPMILSASAHLRPMQKDRYVVSIDLKPALDIQTLDKRMLSDFEKMKNRNFANAFDALLPAKLREPFIKLTGISPDKKINAVTAEERKRVVALMKGIPVSITGFRPITEAIVTSGGITVKEIEPNTMRSKLCPNLYFAGEVIDLDAYTGGFNLQIAFATAHAAATAAAEG